MKRMNAMVEEATYRFKDLVHVYYPHEILIELAEERIKKDTGLNIQILIDDSNIDDYGYYTFIVKDYYLLPDTDLDLLEKEYGDAGNDSLLFTQELIYKMFDGYATGGEVDEYIGRYFDMGGLPLYVIFTGLNYRRFKEKLMLGLSTTRH